MDSIWSKFEQKSEHLFVRFTHKRHPDGQDEITCWLTDLKGIYRETLGCMADVMERVKHENPLLFASDIEETVLETVLQLPKKTTAAKADQITFSRDDNRLHVKYYLSEKVPLKFYWTLTKCDEATFFEMVTVRLLQQLVQAEEKTRDLVDIVKRKDLEIAQYKLDGAQPLTRKHFVTQSFDENQLKTRGKHLFDCSVSEVLPPNSSHSLNAIVDDENEKLNNSSGSRESGSSHVGKTVDISVKCSVPMQSRANKWKRNRGYDEEFNGPVKMKYDDSDDQSDDDGNIINVSNSTVNSDRSNSSTSSSATKPTVDKNPNGDALSTKTPTKKIRKILNL